MYPQSHFLFSLLVGLIVAKFGVFSYEVAFYIAVVAVLIDIDHLIAYFSKYKEMNLKDAWNYSVRGKYHGRTFIHHWIGFLVITLIIVGLYFFNLTWFYVLSIAYYSHMFLDYAHLNVLKIKDKMILRGWGFVEKINKFEVLFDIFLIVGIVLVML
ncbi:metal-dependent hydrolase [Nanoarchaeota archaeon]